jgi:hypothetical protein
LHSSDLPPRSPLKVNLLCIKPLQHMLAAPMQQAKQGTLCVTSTYDLDMLNITQSRRFCMEVAMAGVDKI